MLRVAGDGTVWGMSQPVVVAVSEGDEAHDAIALGIVSARMLGAPLVLAGVVVTTALGGATVVPGWAPAADASQLREYVARELYRQADLVPDDITCTIHVAVAAGVVPGLGVAVEA